MSLTAEQTAAAVGQLQWSSEAIASVTSTGDDPRLAAIVALLGQQATRWANHLPESVLLFPAARVAPASEQVRSAFDALGGVPPELLVDVVARLLRALERELEEFGGRVGTVADAALGRAIAESRTELRHASTRLVAGPTLESSSASIVDALAEIERNGVVAASDAAEG